MDEMRDRLKAVLKNATHKCYRTIEYIDCDNTDCIDCDYLNGTYADAILADGWIRPKFSIGQEVYIRTVKGEIQRRTVAGYYDFGGQKGVYLNGDMYSTDSKHIFATEAEARTALLENTEN